MAGMTRDVFSSHASISACEKGGQWQHALSLLEDIRWTRSLMLGLPSQILGLAVGQTLQMFAPMVVSRFELTWNAD